MISVIIVNYNLSGEILACLDSLDTHPPSLPIEIIVVDNGSNDELRDTLVQRLAIGTGGQYLNLGTNLGFGTACNAGSRQAKGELLCFLNPDTLIDSDFLYQLDAVRRTQNASLIGPAYGPSGRFEFAAGVFPNLCLEFLQIFMIGRHAEALWIAHRRRRSADKPLDVDWVLGACLLIECKQFQEVGGFDEDFFLFFEEMDLCRRLKRAGARIVFDPSIRIHHTGSVSGRKDYAKFTERFYQGKIRYLHKQHRGIMRAFLLGCVRAQLFTQRLLWTLPLHHDMQKVSGKRQGLRSALAFYHQIGRT